MTTTSQWILTIALAVPVLGVAAELGARWWVRRRTRYHVWPPWMRLEVRQHPQVFAEVEPRVRFEVNADGERGAAPPAGEPGVVRVLTAGGSSVECYALDQATSWPGRLEQLLNRPTALQRTGARRVHVGNIGHSGVGAAELEMILERVLPNYDRLDTIIIMVGASTAYHWLEEGAPPDQEPPVVPEDALFARHPGQAFGWSPRATASLELLRRLRQRLFKPLEVKGNVGAWLVAGRKMRAEAKQIRTTMPEPGAVLNHFEHHFRRALRLAMARASRVLVVRQPWLDKLDKQYTDEERSRFWHGGIGRPWKEKVTTYFSLDVINRILSLIDDRVVKVAEQLDLQHLNLRPLMNQGLRHYYDHDHFTPEGAAVAADGIAAALDGSEEARTPPPRRLTQPRIPLAAR